MAIPTLKAVGFCAHYSDPGDWAFDYALRLSRAHTLKLNVFHFLSDPYGVDFDDARNMNRGERARRAIELEKELRLYYDHRAGDYLDVGFRLCEDAEWTELHRCLVVREFQILVLGCPNPMATFGGRLIEEFAEAFISPVVLVGPNYPDQYRLNSRAALISDKLELETREWTQIKKISA
jgi:hypothetical protein